MASPDSGNENFVTLGSLYHRHDALGYDIYFNTNMPCGEVCHREDSVPGIEYSYIFYGILYMVVVDIHDQQVFLSVKTYQHWSKKKTSFLGFISDCFIPCLFNQWLDLAILSLAWLLPFLLPSDHAFGLSSLPITPSPFTLTEVVKPKGCSRGAYWGCIFTFLSYFYSG